jgi:hypothetical protein
MTRKMALRKRTITLPETKNGQKRIALLLSVAATILKDRLSTRRIDGGLEYRAGCDLTGLCQGLS